MAPRLRLGIGAVGTIFVKHAHPSEHIRSKCLDPLPGQKLEGCVVTGKEGRRIRGRVQEAAIFRHAKFGDTNLHAIARWLKLTAEGPEDQLFGVEQTEAVLEAAEEELDESIT